MSESKILTAQEVDEIESRYKLAASAFQPYKEVTDSLSDIPALCATVRQLRKQLDDALVRAAEDQDYDSEQRVKLAASMRSLCVEKVVSIPAKNIVRTTTEEVRGAASFKSDVLRALESVSIHGQEKQ